MKTTQTDPDNMHCQNKELYESIHGKGTYPKRIDPLEIHHRYIDDMNREPAAPAQAQHSPLPWSYSGIDDCVMARINGQRVVVAQIIDGICVENQDAAFIVRACNNAQRLADELKILLTAAEIIDGCETPEDYDIEYLHNAFDKAREALAEWSKHNE